MAGTLGMCANVCVAGYMVVCSRCMRYTYVHRCARVLVWCVCRCVLRSGVNQCVLVEIVFATGCDVRRGDV